MVNLKLEAVLVEHNIITLHFIGGPLLLMVTKNFDYEVDFDVFYLL